MSDINDLYAAIEARTGIKRTRDRRLEKIATDRALEARFQVGLEGTTGITHPVDQLKARTWPLQGTFKGVWENAVWWYYTADDVFLEPLEAWWASQAHRDNLNRTEATHIGIGHYSEKPPTGNTRHYFIAVFTRELMHPAVVVNGMTFPDALSVGPYAAEIGARIFMVQKSSVPPVTKAGLETYNPSEILIVGGTSVVDGSVEAALSAIAPVRRIAGVDRYATAVEVSKA